jgi:hypothetical protein
MTEACETCIELQRCPSCARRFIGPETRSLALFNYNNRILLSHELLDEYSSAYTSSETPFVAWVTVVSRRYQLRHSPKPFLSEAMFRSIWFSYVRLQHLDSNLLCPECGPIPQDTIWDGITLAFSRKHLLPSLHPPTLSDSQSIQRNARYHSGQQLVMDVKLRRAVRKVISGRSLILSREDVGSENDGSENDENHIALSEKAGDELLERIDLIPDVCARLRTVNVELGNIFSKYFGITALREGRHPPIVYRNLFIQVCSYCLVIGV